MSSKSTKKFLVDIEVSINIHIAVDKVHLGTGWMCLWLCCISPFSKNDQMENNLLQMRKVLSGASLFIYKSTGKKFDE